MYSWFCRCRLATVLALSTMFPSVKTSLQSHQPMRRSVNVLLAQTTAACDNSYGWMQNSKGQSPCLVAAYTQGACEGGDWLVVGLPAGDKYDFPNSTTANTCTCSWATYNLLSACTVCQGLTASNWDAYRLGCGSLIGTSYFPDNITLPAETSIPYWAGTNPSTWPDAHFDTLTAQSIANERHADLTNNPENVHKKSVSLGAVIGAAVGGVAVLIAIGAFIVCLILRRRRRRVEGAPSRQYANTHNQPFPDVPKTSFSPPLVQPKTSFSPPLVQQQPLLGLNMQPIRHSSYGPNLTGTRYNYASVTMAVENLIEPFIGVSTTPDRNERLGKNTPGSVTPGTPPESSGYDDMSLLPGEITESSDVLGSSSRGRPRMNPPAYTPSQLVPNRSVEMQEFGYAADRKRKMGSFDSQGRLITDSPFSADNGTRSTTRRVVNATSDEASDPTLV